MTTATTTAAPSAHNPFPPSGEVHPTAGGAAPHIPDRSEWADDGLLADAPTGFMGRTVARALRAHRAMFADLATEWVDDRCKPFTHPTARWLALIACIHDGRAMGPVGVNRLGELIGPTLFMHLNHWTDEIAPDFPDFGGWLDATGQAWTPGELVNDFRAQLAGAEPLGARYAPSMRSGSHGALATCLGLEVIREAMERLAVCEVPPCPDDARLRAALAALASEQPVTGEPAARASRVWSAVLVSEARRLQSEAGAPGANR